MEPQQVMIARIYLHEGEHLLSATLNILRDEAKISGATVVRGIAGFSQAGGTHTAALVALALDLPLVVEFYDHVDKVNFAVQTLRQRLQLNHIVYWPAYGYLTP